MRISAILIATTGMLFGEAAPEDFPFDWSRVGESRIDLSRFLDAPAGKGGNLRAVGETFVTGEGKGIRFWGVNLAIDACFVEKEKAAEVADQLARWGVNLVRFHHIDTDWAGLSSITRKTTRRIWTGRIWIVSTTFLRS